MTDFDKRLTPARGDIAAAHLKGQVTAERFVDGVARQAIASAAAVKRAPADDAMLETQILFGDTFTVFEDKDGWSWGQMASDDYVGFVRSADLSADIVTPTTQTLPSFDPAQPLSLPPYSMTLLQWTPPARQAWRYQNFGTVAGTGSAADDADPDGDGLSNLLEYALGTLPTQTSPSPWSPSTASGYLGLSIAKNAAAAGITWSAESSEDLTNWHPEQTVTLIDNATTFAVRDSVPVGVASRRFLRLRVSAAP